MKIENVNGSSVTFKDGNNINVFPTNSILFISNDSSELINVRLKASRKNILTFNYNDVENIEATSANDMIVKISALTNK